MDIVIIIAFCQFMIWLNRRNRKETEKILRGHEKRPCKCKGVLIHPHLRGEYSWASKNLTLISGPPPLAWGILIA